MSTNQDEKTIKFLEEAKNIVDRGIEPTYKAIADKIGWHNNSLSMARKGKRNIPFEVYKKFTEIYKTEVAPEREEPATDFEQKYLTLLEEHLEIKKALFKRLDKIEEDIKGFKESHQHINEELGILKDANSTIQTFKQSHEALQAQISEVVRVVISMKANQEIMFAFQGAFYDYFLSTVADSERARQVVGKTAREELKRIRKEGIHL